MRHLLRAATTLMLIGQTAAAWGLPWDQDMVDQPSAKPQEAPAPAEPGAVPVSGGETLPAPTTKEGMLDAKEAAAEVPNPVPASPESIARGRYLFEIYCTTCHGPAGRGDGPVGKLFVDPSPADLTDAYTQDQADGQIFFTLTRGRGAMPFYRDALSTRERWDVINFLRREFGAE